MIISVHDSTTKRVGILDNGSFDGGHYSTAKWHRYLSTGASTLELTILKTSNMPSFLQQIDETYYYSIRVDTSDYLFSTLTYTEDDLSISVTCESLSFQLLNETASAYTGTSMSIADYMDKMYLSSSAGLTIGVNELSSSKRSITWTSDTDTRLSRLQSLMTNFGAEFNFETILNSDGTISQFIINIYHERDDTHDRLGKVRNDIILQTDRNITGITKKLDKSNIYTVIAPVGQSSTGTSDSKVYIGSLSDADSYVVKDSEGNVEFKQSGNRLIAVQAVNTYPSTFGGDGNDNYIVRTVTIDTTDASVLRSEALKQLKTNSKPSAEYTISGYIDAAIGDVVTIVDDNMISDKYMQMRVTEQEIDLINGSNNTTVFSDFKTLNSTVKANNTSTTGTVTGSNETDASAIKTGSTAPEGATNGTLWLKTT